MFNLFVTVWAWFGQWGFFSCHCHRATALRAAGLRWALVELLRATAGPLQRSPVGARTHACGPWGIQLPNPRKSLSMHELGLSGAQPFYSTQIFRDEKGTDSREATWPFGNLHLSNSSSQLGAAVGRTSTRNVHHIHGMQAAHPCTQVSCQKSASSPIWGVPRPEWLGYNVPRCVSGYPPSRLFSSSLLLRVPLLFFHPASDPLVGMMFWDPGGKEWVWMGSADRGISGWQKCWGNQRDFSLDARSALLPALMD